MVAASTEHMQGLDAAVFENATDGTRNRFLEFEGSFGVQISLGGEIKIHILDVEMGNEGFTV